MDDLNDILASASEMQRSEYIKDRLYFVAFKTDMKPKNTANTHYFSIDKDFVYENFFNDFGPLTICMLYRYCQKLNRKMTSALYANKKIIHYTSMDEKKRLNAAYLIGAYSIIYLNRQPKEAYRPLVCGNIPPYTQFCDASHGPSMFKISLLDCLNAVYKAHLAGFFNFDDFDAHEYEYYEAIEFGDLNWILPDKFLAFCGPHGESKIKSGYLYHAPETYFNYFRQNNVTTIVRLNVKMYDACRFSNAGFEHKDLYFLDGTTPSDSILRRFLQISEQSTGALAVHCKAGLGRTGSLIGAYIMKHYKFTALEAIAWLRLCRPGSVIGHQQQWMQNKEEWLWTEGELYRKKYQIAEMPKMKYGIYSIQQRNGSERSTCRQPATVIATATTATPAVTTTFGQQNLNKSGSPNSSILTGQTSNILRDRVRKISQKVDTMRLNDDKSCGGPTDENQQYSPKSRSDENKQYLPVATTLSSGGAGVTATITSATAGAPLVTATTVGQELKKQTQGDQLNEIKAMRRRHSRSVNASESLDDILSNKHTRAKSQPFRNNSLPQQQPAPPATVTSRLNRMVLCNKRGGEGYGQVTAAGNHNNNNNNNNNMAGGKLLNSVSAAASATATQNINICQMSKMTIKENNINASKQQPQQQNIVPATAVAAVRRSSRIDHVNYNHLHVTPRGRSRGNYCSLPTPPIATAATATILTNNNNSLMANPFNSKFQTSMVVKNRRQTRQQNGRQTDDVIVNNKLNSTALATITSSTLPIEKRQSATTTSATAAAVVDNDDLLNGNVDQITIKSTKRGKRSLSSTRIEKEKSDEKNTKLLRKAFCGQQQQTSQQTPTNVSVWKRSQNQFNLNKSSKTLPAAPATATSVQAEQQHNISLRLRSKR